MSNPEDIIIDTQTLIKMENALGAKIARELSLKLYKMLAEKIEQLKEACAKDDIAVITEMLHKIVSNAAPLGAVGLQNMARELETACMGGQHELFRKKKQMLLWLAEETVLVLGRHLQ